MRGFLGLREKTQRKFEEFFEKMGRMYEGKEFEIAYSDIQQSTGTASGTLKRALDSMVTSGVLEIQPGRNSRYGRFRYLKYSLPQESKPDNSPSSQKENETVTRTETPPPTESNTIERAIQRSGDEGRDLTQEVEELAHLTNHLLRRVRNQEMTIALLQDRVAELEDKLYKR